MSGFQSGEHLPKRRQGEQPIEPSMLPRQRRGTTPQMHGRYPEFDVLEQAPHWDEATRRTVLARLETPPVRFFDEREIRTLRAFTDVTLAQDDEPRIPVAEMIDAKLHEGRLDGFRFADMPPDPQAMRLVLRGLDDEAARRGAASFADLGADAQLEVVKAFAAGKLEGGVWEGLPVKRAWQLAMRLALPAFYSHPWAWNEIGYGGPAYPRGFMRLGIGLSEPWEGEEAPGLGLEFQEDLDDHPELRP